MANSNDTAKVVENKKAKIETVWVVLRQPEGCSFRPIGVDGIIHGRRPVELAANIPSINAAISTNQLRKISKSEAEAIIKKLDALTKDVK